MKIWRIYRLPGSRQFWHIDAGADTPVINVTAFRSAVDTKSVDIGEGHPRAWIEIERSAHIELHVINGTAIFEYAGVVAAVREVLDMNPLPPKESE
jgi:hypothetical protein